jgi:4-amino-4-deoxy-L-arabinose transferase-like glycosyltransferase
VLCALFVVIYLPALNDVAKYHGDERFYTDAAIRMVRTGTWATATYPDGTPRFNKPLLTYWVVAASFRALGIGVVASRLPFLVAGCLLSVVTFVLGRHMLGDTGAALVAAVIVLANPQLAVLSTRATPDILLVLFVTVSFAGFARLLGGDRRRRAYAAAWIGAGLAVAAKGAPGVVAVGYCVAAAALSGPAAVWVLIDVPLMALGAAIATAGLLPPFLEHGREALDVLYYDQIGARPVIMSVRELLSNAWTYFLGTIVDLLPWTIFVLLAVALNRAGVRQTARRHRSMFLFGIGWWIALVTVFATHDFMRPRYLAPSYPALALVMVAVLDGAAASSQSAARALRATATVLLGSLLVGGAALVIGGTAVDERLTLAGVLWMAVGTAGILRRPSMHATLAGVAVATMVAIATTDALVRPVFDASPAPALAACLRTRLADGQPGATVDEAPNLANKIRLVSGGLVDLATLPADVDRETLGRYAAIVVPPTEAEGWRKRGYQLDPCGYQYAHWSPAEVWQVVVGSPARREEAFERHRRYYFVGTPPR